MPETSLFEAACRLSGKVSGADLRTPEIYALPMLTQARCWWLAVESVASAAGCGDRSPLTRARRYEVPGHDRGFWVASGAPSDSRLTKKPAQPSRCHLIPSLPCTGRFSPTEVSLSRRAPRLGSCYVGAPDKRLALGIKSCE